MATMKEIKERAAAIRAAKGLPDPAEQTAPTRREAPEEGGVQALRKWLAGSQIGAAIDSAAKGITFGGADEAKAALYSAFSPKSYEEELEPIRETSKQLEEDNPVTSTVAGVAGSILPSLLVPGSGAASMGQAISRGIVGGAASSGAQGFGEGEGGFSKRMGAAANDALWGGLLGGSVGAASRGLGKRAATKAARAARPAVPALRDAKNAAYEAVEKSGAVIDQKDLRLMAQEAGKARSNFSYSPDMDVDKPIENFLVKMKEFSEKPGPHKTVGQLDHMRRDAWKSYNRTNDGRFLDIVNTIDSTIEKNLQGSALLDTARVANSRYKKAELLDHVIQKVNRNSDIHGNKATKFKTAISNILGNQKTIHWFNAEERQAMETIVAGHLPDKIEQQIGQFAPTGSGMVKLITLAASLHNPLIGGAATAGIAAKSLAGRATENQVENLMNMVQGFTPGPAMTKPSALSKGAIRQAATGAPNLMHMLFNPNEAAAEEPAPPSPLIEMLQQRQ